MVFSDSGTCGVEAGAALAGSLIPGTLSAAKEHPDTKRTSVSEARIGKKSFRQITAQIIAAKGRCMQARHLFQQPTRLSGIPAG
ncbi:MAG: hypothetical protein WAK31_31320 [Chthoniobacterales bacterium]